MAVTQYCLKWGRALVHVGGMGLRFRCVRRLILWLAAGVSLAARAADFPDSQASPFLVRSWQTEQGLPNNMILAITQTPDGYLWLGTDKGLARFDGVHCRIFGLQDGLQALQISQLLVDSHGVLWVGTVGGGLSRYAKGVFQTFTARDGLAGDSINALLEDTNGVLWVGTTIGLFHEKEGRFEPAGNGMASSYLSAHAQDRKGNIWLSTLRTGLIRFHDGTFSPVPGLPDLKTIRANYLMVDDQDRLWAGLQNGTVMYLEKEHWVKYGVNDGLPQAMINKLAQTSDGVVWAGTLDEGLYYLKNGRFHALRVADGLSDDAIVSLYVDRQQNIWVGTRSGGLNQLSPKKLSICHVRDGDSERLPLALAQTTNGDLWVGAAGRGIYHWNDGQFTQFLLKPPMSGHMFVGAMLGARDGSLWWGAGPAFFQARDGVVIASYNGLDWLQGDRVLSLCEDNNGGLWVGTYNGQVQRLQAGQFKPILGLSGKPVTALAQGADGTLWIGTMGAGLTRWQKGKLTTFTTKDGLSSDLIRTLYLDGQGTLWIGTTSGGLVRWSQGQFAVFTPAEGLIDDTVQQILEDDDGCLWLGCNRGICRVRKSALEELAAGKSSFIFPLVFGQSEGMLSEQCEANFASALKTQSGRLCFCTAKGIVIIDPRQQVANATPPTVLLEDVLVDETNLPLASPVMDAGGMKAAVTEISTGPHRIEFDYTGLNWNAPAKIRFRYRLEGLDADWVDAGGSRAAVYSYVPAGNYHFHVIACNSDGLWNDTGAAFAFVVRPHFWQTPWFYTAGILALLGLTGGSIRYVERRRFRARLRRLEQEQIMERERARIARDLHDELGSSLTRISMLSDLGESHDNSVEQLKTRVGKISTFAIRTARSLDEIVWAVNPRHDSLRSLLEYLTQFARELFEETGVHCRFQIPEDLPRSPLPPEMRHHIFLVIKEALTNALKHAHAREVSLRAKLLRRQIAISVQDNGSGFDAERVAPSTGRSGLRNMRQRIESLGGHFSLQTAPGHGTTVTIVVDCPFVPEPALPPENRPPEG